jgi:D-sedoheptulose 7-phosphate isomerase
MSTVPSRRKMNGTPDLATKMLSSAAYLRQVSWATEQLSFPLIDRVAETLWDAYQKSRTVYVFGNGGSAALASHSACDLGKGTVVNGTRRFRVLALTDNVPLMTAWANDARYEDIFAEQLRSFLQEDDVAFAISGSGNSVNVLNGLAVAREMGAFTIGLTGYQGGRMKSFCRLCIVVPSDNMQIIEDVHLSVMHAIFTSLRHRVVDLTEASSLAATND